MQQYLERYAEADLPRPPLREQPWHNVLVIPAYGESAELLTRLQKPPCANGNTLVILILNRPASDTGTEANTPLRSALTGLTVEDGEASLYRLGDRSSLYVYDMEARRGATPSDRGVGLARKLGCDIALHWMAAGAISGEWLYSSDADCELPADYFRKLEHADKTAVAAAFPFRHVPGPDPQCNAATALYELRLHHYVLGLAYAGSPYAHHTLGSCLAVKAVAYAQVRGFPRRSGAEDFYLLNKVAKLGPVAKPGGDTIAIASRMSSRVPFGTGPAVADIATSAATQSLPLFYHPQCFEALRAALTAIPLLRYTSEKQLPLTLENSGLDARLADASAAALTDMGLAAALAHCLRQGKTEAQFARQFHQWFDGFRTLKLIHTLRDTGWPMVSLAELCALSPDLWPGETQAADDVEGKRAAIARHWHWHP